MPQAKAKSPIPHPYIYIKKKRRNLPDGAWDHTINPAINTLAPQINSVTYVGLMVYFTGLSECVWTEKRKEGADEAVTR